ncbi:LamG-like jellyroll fold domain-containing protein [Hwangdonia lutea]|uniref:LamG-like jellyroll fold domain-containing protein n=1 Tax=Hwangdonia lutea TaxID=3075823 RepID=A0AA97EJE9_9FLAO|nr:LamG-like jellyroll fold domain-containing protein [Hwangdonia sp. SCSIO 19198]WOD42327.1 LamG-like jellyroll fold domain-containing protein [Hwangdonia sp. SCSIO 19198]
MKRSLPLFGVSPAKFLILFLLVSFVSNAQVIQVERVGGAVVTQGSTITITAGTSIDFRITNQAFDCSKLKVRDVDISNPTDFDITPNNPKKNIRTQWCTWPWQANKTYLDFEIENISPSCVTASTVVTIEIKDQPDFTFTVEVASSPTLVVLGGSPFQDVFHNDTNTTDDNGTYFGVVDEGNTVTRRFLIGNAGSCDMDFTNATSNNPDFTINTPLGTLPINGINPYWGTYLDITFTAPNGGSGTQQAIISVFTNDTDYTPFYLVVEAEMFDENIPGPGGITSNFKLWLKSTRGIVKSGSTLTEWHDLGTNGKDATTVAGKEPTYLDTATDNINFNPVVKFENDGMGTEQYMYNNDAPISGFYNHDIFIVMMPDATMTSTSSRNTIFAGVDSGNAGDITGVGFGDYSSRFTNEALSYNQDVPSPSGSYNGEAVLNATYSNAGIINVRNDASSSPTKQDILYNSNVLTTSNVSDVSFTNIDGSEYWIGKNFDIAGSLNGRVAEIFTFSERLSDADRQKVESYLAIKYGITLGAATEATKNYVNSFNTSVWDATANAGFNYHVAGIGRDSISDLNQKQSKSINYTNAVTIGLGGVFDTNSLNPNEFEKDGDFLVWGNNNGALSGTDTNSITIASGVTTTVTRIDRKWKIVESNEDVNGDVETVYVSIPTAAFSTFTKTADEEYALIVADNANFTNTDIIDVIPLRSDGGTSLETWYDFEGEKYFTFGKLSKISNSSAISIASGDYLVGDYLLNLGVDSFTISAWVKLASNASDRTIMAKGEKLQMIINASGNIEVYVDDTITPKITSTMAVDDGVWHQLTFIYDSGTIYIYIDGLLDKSVPNIVHPTPNYNHYAVGALYIDRNTVTNPLLGDIDEVYIWDTALTQNQVRYLMNQEIERFDVSGTDYVSGKVLPQGAANNPTAAIPWSNLRVYYDFNSFYGSTIEGLTDDRYFLRLNYLNKTKTIRGNQTAPLPYVSAANGAWGAATTWSNSSDQMIPNSQSLDGSTVVGWNIVEIGHDITSGDRDITLLGLKQTSGKLTIADPVDPQDETNSGQALTVTNYLEIDGVIDLVGESQFIQTEGSILDADSGGFIERDQQGTANGYNYNYWSSSVGPITGSTATRGTGVSYLNNNHTIDGVLNDGTNTDLYLGIDFIPNQNTGSGPPPPPPGTAKEISSYWLYKFYGPEDDYFSWQSIDQNTSLQAGEGFTMKGTLGAVAITDQQNYVFKGLPNNGDITLPLDKTAGDVDRLIGNPYPSAIDATEFILDNMSIASGGNNTNGTIFNGALYFWDHFGEENTHVLKGYVGGYATYNLTGGVAAISNDARINNTSDGGNPANGSKTPGQYIPVNQGFFVSTAIDGFTDDNGAVISVVDGGDIVFKNSQRVFATEQGGSSTFMRGSNTKKSTSKTQRQENDYTNSASIKLMYSSPKGYYRQLLLGTNTNASKGFDLGYDAFMIDASEEDMYWNIGQRKFVIQGVNNFDDTNEFPLGLVVKNSGIVKIKLDSVENLDTSKTLYIKDNVTNEVVLINNKPFEMFLDAGSYNDRFSLVFQSQSLTTEDVEIADNVSVYFDKSISELKVRGLNGSELLSITLFNIIGQEIKYIDYTSNKTSKQIHVNTGAYIVQLNTDRGTINKKIIIE